MRTRRISIGLALLGAWLIAGAKVYDGIAWSAPAPVASAHRDSHRPDRYGLEGQHRRRVNVRRRASHHPPERIAISDPPSAPNSPPSLALPKTASEQPQGDLAYVEELLKNLIGVTGLAPLLAALIAGCFAWRIAAVYTKRLKQIELTLEFSRRFHDLIQRQRVLNTKYDRRRIATPAAPDTPIEVQDATAWWWCFFDLLLYEYDFYQKGMVRKSCFEEWMIWRWHDFHPVPGARRGEHAGFHIPKGGKFGGSIPRTEPG